jgi:uncharacterized membrane protein YecN with MAPEG domain
VKIESSKVRRRSAVRVTLGDDADDLLEQRAARRGAADDHLPAGLNAHAGVDEQLGELAISWIRHGDGI